MRMRSPAGTALIPLALAGAMLGSTSAQSNDLIGEVETQVTQEQDTLLDIARDHDLGYVEIRAANPGIDPWLPGAGKTITLPMRHVLPRAPQRGIVINLAELRLYYYPTKGEPRSFPIGIGGEGKETPVGHTKVVEKRTHPIWIPTKSEHDENSDLPLSVGPGPDNPMGDFALYLGWKGYAIHGTNKPYSIGRRDSHGCIRLYPEDIEWLFPRAAIDTSVTVVNQPAKAGWFEGELYLEIHPTQEDADSLEVEGVPRSTEGIDADDVVAKAAGRDAERLDWYAIHSAEIRRDGVPVRVTLPRRD